MEDNNASELATSNHPYNVGAYLIKRLQSLGVSHVFGVPGDYVLGFFKQLSDSQLNLVTTCDELNAGYAADAYARIRGLGVVCVTYSVGGLKVVNAAAQAYAEKSPLVVIAGAPGFKERVGNPLLHHKDPPISTWQKETDRARKDLRLTRQPTLQMGHRRRQGPISPAGCRPSVSPDTSDRRTAVLRLGGELRDE